jgi:hypothetical protein
LRACACQERSKNAAGNREDREFYQLPEMVKIDDCERRGIVGPSVRIWGKIAESFAILIFSRAGLFSLVFRR